MVQHIVLLKSQVGQHGGLEKYASRIAQGFLDQGMDVSILTTGLSRDPIHHRDVTVHSIKTCRWPAFWRMEQFDRFAQRFLHEHPADLVFGMDRNRFQTHYRAGNGVHAEFLRSRSLIESLPKQMSFYLNPLHLKILQLEKCAFENPALIRLFANSHMVRRQILEHYRTDPSKIEVIHNGVEWKEMENDFHVWANVRKNAALDRGLDPSVFHFLFIGNGYLRKGLKQLLRALALIKKEEFHLSVIGKDSHWEEYQALAQALGIRSRITFFGPQKEIRPFYQIADALVIPSFYDPFANVTVEALAMGLFVVSSLSNGGHEVLSSDNGTVIPNLLDLDSIAESLLIALRHPKTIESAQKIRQSVQRLDFSHQLQLLIHSCLGKSHGS
ncbi:MAG: WabG [Parachlamydiales bacterium]|nr:WabG [Parachlamydiales bacterium]